MLIKPRHSCVDSMGHCVTPYILNWMANASNIVDMLHSMNIAFGSDPPLYTMPQGRAPRDRPPQDAHAQLTHVYARRSAGYVETAANGHGDGHAHIQHPQATYTVPQASFIDPPQHVQPPPQPPPSQYQHQDQHYQASPPQQQQQQQQQSQQSQQEEQQHAFAPGQQQYRNPMQPGSPRSRFTQHSVPVAGVATLPAAVAMAASSSEAVPSATASASADRSAGPMAAFRTSAIAELTAKLRAALQADSTAFAVEYDRTLAKQRSLQERGQAIRSMATALAEERTGLETAVGALHAHAREVSGWLEQHGKAAAEASRSISVDELVVGASPRDDQVARAAADDAAVEDTLYALDDMLARGRLPFDNYMKRVRSLCREQFTARETARRVMAAERYGES